MFCGNNKNNNTKIRPLNNRFYEEKMKRRCAPNYGNFVDDIACINLIKIISFRFFLQYQKKNQIKTVSILIQIELNEFHWPIRK